MAAFPVPKEGILLTHFIVSDDVERSRRFYTDVLGGQTVRAGEPSFVALANSWIIINVGGGPTEDKPTVTLETPPDPDRTSSFLNVRVADIEQVHADWSARGRLWQEAGLGEAGDGIGLEHIELPALVEHQVDPRKAVAAKQSVGAQR